MKTLTTNKWLRVITLCILYFAQGFPWGFMLTALLSFLASKGLTLAESGQLTAMAYLPWTFKLFWGPIIDSFTYRAMGRRRPWILFAQFGMTITLIAMILMGDLLSNVSLLGWMFFFHNCFWFYCIVSKDLQPFIVRFIWLNCHFWATLYKQLMLNTIRWIIWVLLYLYFELPKANL